MRYHGRSVELVIRTALADTVRGYCAQRPYRAYHHASSIMATTLYVSGRYEDYYMTRAPLRASYCIVYCTQYCIFAEYSKSVHACECGVRGEERPVHRTGA